MSKLEQTNWDDVINKIKNNKFAIILMLAFIVIGSVNTLFDTNVFKSTYRYASTWFGTKEKTLAEHLDDDGNFKLGDLKAKIIKTKGLWGVYYLLIETNDNRSNVVVQYAYMEKYYPKYKQLNRQTLVLLKNGKLKLLSTTIHGIPIDGNYPFKNFDCEKDKPNAIKVIDRSEISDKQKNGHVIELYFDITMAYGVNKLCLGSRKNYLKEEFKDLANQNLEL